MVERIACLSGWNGLQFDRSFEYYVRPSVHLTSASFGISIFPSCFPSCVVEVVDVLSLCLGEEDCPGVTRGDLDARD